MNIEVGQIWVSTYADGWTVTVKEFYKHNGMVEYVDDDGENSCHVTNFIDEFEFLREGVTKHSHYFKDVSDYKEIDVYALCKIFEIDDPSGCTQHAIKKLLVTGKRGHKDRLRDLQDVVDTVKRLIELETGNE